MVKSGITVFNTSPLIFLARLDFIKQAIELFGSCSCLPKGVMEEICAKKDQAGQIITDLLNKEKLCIREARLTPLVEKYRRRMGRGESEAIVLAIETEADFVILDDFVARKEAEKLGLRVKGTLGIVKKLLIEEKIGIDDMEEFYRTLWAMNFRIKKSVFDKIMRDI